MFRIDPDVYEGHYRWRREQGWEGWFNGEPLEGVLNSLSARLDEVDLPGLRVLEVGCGAGDQSLLLASRGLEVTGIDISPTAVEWAREKAIRAGLSATFEVGDVRDLAGLADGSFDWVLDGNCWHFIIGEGRAQFLSSVMRVLRPGGLFLGNSLCGDPPAMAGVDIAARVQVMDGVAVTYFASPEELLKELVTAGFEVVRHRLEEGEAGKRQDFLLAEAVKPA